MVFKKEIRIIAWDDCKHRRGQRKKDILVVGVIFRGGQFIDGLLSTSVKLDGLDATSKIIKAINRSRHRDQLRVIMLDGITFAGFNLVDIKMLNMKTKMPVIAVIRKKPDVNSFKSALKIFPDYNKRLKIVENAGIPKKWNKIYYQCCGLSDDDCKKILELSTIRSNIPEPIRVAHLIASGLSGESKGRA